MRLDQKAIEEILATKIAWWLAAVIVPDL